MIKILDTSVISAAGKNIHSLNLLDVISERYGVVVTEAVRQECKNYKDRSLLSLIDSFDIVNDPRVARIAEVILRYRDVLGPGERTAIAASVILTSQGRANFVVLDDSKARKFAQSAGHLPEVAELLGMNVDIKVTGTVGLIKHLFDIGLISEKQKQDVAYDLEMGDFRISRELLDLLR